MRILVTGPRDWTNGKALAARLLVVAYDDDVTLIEGEAEGFDTMSRTLAEVFGWKVEPYRPDYVIYGKAAPHIRNGTMVATGADVCVAGYLPCIKPDCKRPQPHGTHGTADCVSKARKAGIPVSTIHGTRKV
jgi:hypothetical protein